METNIVQHVPIFTYFEHNIAQDGMTPMINLLWEVILEMFVLKNFPWWLPNNQEVNYTIFREVFWRPLACISNQKLCSKLAISGVGYHQMINRLLSWDHDCFRLKSSNFSRDKFTRNRINIGLVVWKSKTPPPEGKRSNRNVDTPLIIQSWCLFFTKKVKLFHLL